MYKTKNVSLRGKTAVWLLAIAATMVAICTPLLGDGLVVHAAGISGWQSGFWPNNDTYPDVVSDCNGQSGHGGVVPDQCIFHIVSSGAQLGSYTQASPDTVSQCGQSQGATFTLNWSSSATTTYTWGTDTTVSLNAAAPLAEGLVGALTASLVVSQSWSVGQTATSGGSVSVMIPAGKKGRIIWAPQLEVVHGWVEIHYPKRVFGHYIWYYPSQGSSAIQVTTPKQLSDGSADGRYSSVVVPC